MRILFLLLFFPAITRASFLGHQLKEAVKARVSYAGKTRLDTSKLTTKTYQDLNEGSYIEAA